MPRLTINIGTHGVPTTVSEMRKKLARVLSKLNGNQVVSFSFDMDDQQYAPRQCSMPTVLGASYDLSNTAPSGLDAYARRMKAATPRDIIAQEND